MSLPKVLIFVSAERATGWAQVPLRKSPALGMPPALPPTTPTPPGLHAPTASAAPDTQQMFTRNGQYTPARAGLHNKIIGQFAGDNHADSDLAKLYADHAAGSAQKHAIFMMGGGGSGKSYYAKNKFLKHPRFSLVDPDAIKEHLPEYDPKSPSHVHEESSDLAKRLQSHLHETGKSYVYDGTGANADSLSKKMKMAKDAGYQVHLHYASVPLSAALQRNAARTRRVPEDVLIGQHKQVRDSFHKVKGLADRVRVFDNTADDVYAPSQAKVRRQEITNRSGADIPHEVQKAVQHYMNGHKPTPRHNPSEKVQKIVLKPHHYILGVVRDGKVHVQDIVHNNVSERALLGQSPALSPIPVARLKEMGAKFPDA